MHLDKNYRDYTSAANALCLTKPKAGVVQNVVRKPTTTPRPANGITSFRNER
jgi:hypothetical protein